MDDTRTRLVESALTLLRAEGLDAVTLRAVGDLSGVSRTAPYRHFADKTALLAALAERVLGDLTDHVASAVRGRESRRERLRALYLAYAGYAVAHPEEYRLVFHAKFLAGHHPALETAMDRAVELIVAEILPPSVAGGPSGPEDETAANGHDRDAPARQDAPAHRDAPAYRGALTCADGGNPASGQDHDPREAAMVAVLATAHGLAELATSGHLSHKALPLTAVVDALLPT
ncbi:TetR/AcrR family transcriptional regulator [Sphaerisporangium melleum]|uniref:TetR/AcrR family transcriptional regulator n=1 Tax=Sphaerisporangium melleum TaxID=321316 RepID=UPI001E64D95B|nr:TetR/AcrR family transcriptional regulator [Sphaerisporangium melleum]